MSTAQRLSLRRVASTALDVLAFLPLSRGMQLESLGFLLALAPFYVVFGFVLSSIEATAFSSGPGPIRPRDWLGGIAAGVLTAALATLCVRAQPGAELGQALSAWFAQLGTAGVVRRVLYSSLCFMLAYCVIGSATWPFVRPFYEDPASPLKLRIPSGRIVVLLQLGRGVLATCVLLPLIAALSDRGAQENWLRLSLSVAVTSSVVPLLNAVEWPVRLRVVHGVEICVFSFVQGFAWWWFLCR